MIAITIVYVAGATTFFVMQRKNEISKQTNVVEKQVKEKEGLREKEEKLKQAIENEPDNAKNREELGKIYYQEGKLKESIEQYKKALIVNPNDIETHIAIAQLYMSRRELRREALVHLKKVEKQAPDHSKIKVVKLWISSLEGKAKK